MIAETSTISAVIELIAQRAASDPRGVAVRAKRRGIWHELTWSALDREVAIVAEGLRSVGVSPGQTVAIMAENRLEWLTAYLAIQRLGASLLAISSRETPETVGARLAARDVRVIVCGDQEHVDAVIDSGYAPAAAVVMDPAGLERYPQSWIVAFDRVRTAGAEVAAAPPHGREISTVEHVNAELVDVPARVMESNSANVAEILGIGKGDRMLVVAPLDDAVTRSVDIAAAIHGGATIHFPESPTSVPEDLVEVRPTILAGPRRAFELIHFDARVEQHRTGALRGAMIRWAYRGGRSGAASPRRLLVLEHIAARHGLSKLRHVVVTGEERLARETRGFLDALGIDVLHAWGTPRLGGLVLVESDVVVPEGAELRDDERARADDWRAQFATSGELTGAALEAELREHEAFRRAIVVDTPRGRMAVFELDFDAAALWATRRKVEFSTKTSLAIAPAIHELVESAIEKSGGTDVVDGYVIAPRELTAAEGFLTSSEVVIRERVADVFTDSIRTVSGRAHRKGARA